VTRGAEPSVFKFHELYFCSYTKKDTPAETTDKRRLQIHIEKGYSLMRIFNLINTDVQSNIFIYEGVRFWRESNQFMVQHGETVVEPGDVLDYEEFRRVVVLAKRVENDGREFR
jgi:hypothetical protein